MDAIQTLTRLLTHAAWANTACLDALELLDPAPPRALRWMAHVLGAEEVWQERLLQTGRTTEVWPALDLPACRTLAERTAVRWQEILRGLDPARIDAPVAYVNSKGERFESSAHDILVHIGMHGAHHRGQIVAELRASGAEPPYLDYIHAVRQGFLA